MKSDRYKVEDRLRPVKPNLTRIIFTGIHRYTQGRVPINNQKGGAGVCEMRALLCEEDPINSLLEREMRGLNRRADIGARWSTPGIENDLKVLFHYRHN